MPGRIERSCRRPWCTIVQQGQVAVPAVADGGHVNPAASSRPNTSAGASRASTRYGTITRAYGLTNTAAATNAAAASPRRLRGDHGAEQEQPERQIELSESQLLDEKFAVSSSEGPKSTRSDRRLLGSRRATGAGMPRSSPPSA